MKQPTPASLDGLLIGKVAMISGTGSGQGRAAARVFSRQDATVVGCDVDVDGARETVSMVERQGSTMISIAALDLADPDEAERWMTTAVEQFGGIDILYNKAAALFARGPFGESKLSEWQLSIRNDLTIVSGRDTCAL